MSLVTHYNLKFNGEAMPHGRLPVVDISALTQLTGKA